MERGEHSHLYVYSQLFWSPLTGNLSMSIRVVRVPCSAFIDIQDLSQRTLKKASEAFTSQIVALCLGADVGHDCHWSGLRGYIIDYAFFAVYGDGFICRRSRNSLSLTVTGSMSVETPCSPAINTSRLV